LDRLVEARANFDDRALCGHPPVLRTPTEMDLTHADLDLANARLEVVQSKLALTDGGMSCRLHAEN